MKAKAKIEVKQGFKSIDEDNYMYGATILKDSIVDYQIVNNMVEVWIGTYYTHFQIDKFFEKFEKID